MNTNLTNIAPLVENQFPAFYKEEGDNFIQFVKAFYEWLDEQGPIYKSRRLLETYDIDTVGTDYINYFLSKYMRGIPRNIVSDKRLLEKHILDFYRTKGSSEGIILLFKILYNLEAKVYLPQTNVLRASSGKWIRRRYVEVEERNLNYTYKGQLVTGSSSGATAYVTNVVRLYSLNNDTFVMYLSDINEGPTGQEFLVGEYLTYSGLSINDATYIKGSPVSANVVGSSTDNATGEQLFTSNTTGEGLKFNVSSIFDPNFARGYVEFKIKSGGYGYANDSPVEVYYNTANTGNGATFSVGALTNTTSFTYNITNTNTMLGAWLNAVSWGANLISANLSSTINTGLAYNTITIGEIASLRAVTSGDHNYNGSLTVVMNDKRISGYNLMTSNGSIWGNNAIIEGRLATGNGVIKTVELVSSGIGYNTQGEELQFINASNNEHTAALSLNIGALGYDEGYWEDTQGFINSNMYLTDSDYYQDFSYEIQLEKSLDKYIDVLKQVMHPVGNKVFGKPLIIDSVSASQTILVDSLTVT